MTIKTHTFPPASKPPSGVIFPQQSHGNHIVEVVTGLENLSHCDGLWTNYKEFLLGVKTADCAPICMWDDEKFGIVHAGWRGTVNGAIENLLSKFETGLQSKKRDRSPILNIWIGPILPRFEIQPDDCYKQIHHKFGDQFFSEVDLESRSTLMFEFKKCLQFMLPQAQFDSRSTFDDLSLASWRRDKAFPKGQNVTVIGATNHF